MKQCKQKCQEKKKLTNLQIIQKKELLVGKKKHVQIIYYSLIIHYWKFMLQKEGGFVASCLMYSVIQCRVYLLSLICHL